MILKKHILYEFKSWLGRTFLSSPPPLQEAENFLHFGCGSNIFEGFINADFYALSLTRPSNKIQWMIDLRYPLPCEDGAFDGIYSEHTVEHLSPIDAQNLFLELLRIMKKGAILRLSVPDLDKYIQYCDGSLPDPEFSYFQKKFKSRCQAMQHITQNHGHLSLWNFDELQYALKHAGFKSIRKCAFRSSQSPKLALDQEARAWESLYVEAMKP